MPKIQSQAGVSLGDVYDVVGSRIGVEELEAREVNLVHEMGAQIHSERLLGFQLVMASGDIAQSLNFSDQLGAFPDSVNRILSCTCSVAAGEAGRISDAQVSIVLPSAQEVVIWQWDSVNGLEGTIRFQLNGAATADRVSLLSPLTFVQQLVTRSGFARRMATLSFRGKTLAFGAGTVNASVVLHVLRPNTGAPAPGAPSSHGLPLPSW